jgi:glycosyltransferase involved in cell wall biosynthesis
MRVIVVTSLTGFPFGTANAKRINLIGKSILAAGYEFHVLTNSIQVNKYNIKTKGVNDGISFEYLHQKSLNGNLSTFKKIQYIFAGCLRLFGSFRKFSKNEDIVYSYNHGTLFNLYIILLCKMFNIKLVQEINEWYHNDLNRSLEKRIIEGPLVRKSNGALVISELIGKNVSEINPKLKLLKIPVLEDFSQGKNVEVQQRTIEKYCFWMGDVDGYQNDVFFIIKACSDVHKMGIPLQFYISGPCNDDTFNKIKETANQFDFPIQQIKLLGYISEEELNTYCNNAFLFVVPLWDDERSKSRFPTKIASFMRAGRPVVTCNIGEISNLLTDSVNVLYYSEGDFKDLSLKMKRLFDDNELYERISNESYNFAAKYFNYLSYSNKIKLFLNNL